LSEVIHSTSTGKFNLYRVCSFVISKTGIIKFRPGLRIRLYFQKNSTVFTVFGHTILTARSASIKSKPIANMNQPADNSEINNIAIGQNINNNGINSAIICKIKL
jgi:hypothetical protein